MKNFCGRHNCSSCPCCFPCPPRRCTPCPPCPPVPPQPPAPHDVLVAAGTGTDPHHFTSLTFDIPFGPTLYSSGDAVSHMADSPDFVILESGEYRIHYQLSAYNPAVAIPEIDFLVHLVSREQGILNTIHFTMQNQLIQRIVTAQLTRGDVLFLQGVQPELTEMSFNSMAIVFEKI